MYEEEGPARPACPAGDRDTPETSSCTSCPSLKTRKDDRHAEATGDVKVTTGSIMDRGRASGAYREVE